VLPNLETILIIGTFIVLATILTLYYLQKAEEQNLQDKANQLGRPIRVRHYDHGYRYKGYGMRRYAIRRPDKIYYPTKCTDKQTVLNLQEDDNEKRFKEYLKKATS
jgi:hypothetical protein